MILSKNINRLSQNNLFKNNLTYQFVNIIFQNQYNFYVDFKGLLFFDDGSPTIYPNSIRDVKFITQLYKNLKPSTKQSYPYYGQFWGEKNYVRSSISPVVYNQIDKENNLQFSIGQIKKFDPQSLEIDSNGRIWHPFSEQVKGVFSNELMTNFLQNFQNKNGTTFLNYEGKKYPIKNKTDHL